MAGGEIPKERTVQRGILKMLGKSFPRVVAHHSPNGAHLAGSGNARFKQMGALKGDGMRPGFPDLLCLWSPRKGCFIEVKRAKTGKVSPEQKVMIETLEALAWPVRIVTSVDDAYTFLRDCGAPWNGVDGRLDPKADMYAEVAA